jgi:hypothetical protein
MAKLLKDHLLISSIENENKLAKAAWQLNFEGRQAWLGFEKPVDIRGDFQSFWDT